VDRLFIMANTGDTACCYALTRGHNVLFQRAEGVTPKAFLLNFPIGEVIEAIVEAPPLASPS
jgi:hypothetical protein